MDNDDLPTEYFSDIFPTWRVLAGWSGNLVRRYTVWRCDVTATFFSKQSWIYTAKLSGLFCSVIQSAPRRRFSINFTAGRVSTRDGPGGGTMQGDVFTTTFTNLSFSDSLSPVLTSPTLPVFQIAVRGLEFLSRWVTVVAVADVLICTGTDNKIIFDDSSGAICRNHRLNRQIFQKWII